MLPVVFFRKNSNRDLRSLPALASLFQLVCPLAVVGVDGLGTNAVEAPGHNMRVQLCRFRSAAGLILGSRRLIKEEAQAPVIAQEGNRIRVRPDLHSSVG